MDAMSAAGAAVPVRLLLAAAVVLYLVLCRALRFRRERAMLRQQDHTYSCTDRASLAPMTAVDAQAILAALQQREFPWMHTLAIEFGIFKTYGIPTISRLVVATRNVTAPMPAAKRAADTLAILTELMVHPPAAPRALRALARMNCLHRPYVAAGQIRNEDLLYTLAACVAEPVRFIARYEWRPLNPVERCALGVFWRGVGDAMGIDYRPCLARAGAWPDGLAFADDLTAWAAAYERDHMRPHPANRPPTRRFVALLLGLAPPALHPAARTALAVLMSERLREAIAYDEPGLGACLLVYALLAARRFVLRHLALPRRGVHRVTAQHADPVTGRVQLLDYLAAPWYVRPTLWNRWGPGALARRAAGAVLPGDPRPDDDNPKGGPTYLPEGFLVDDLGPFNTMGVGAKETAAEVERLRAMRTGGCPFA